MEPPQVKEVIISYKEKGKGTSLDPSREVLQVHSKGGDFIAENDPVETGFSLFDMLNFARWIDDKYGGLTSDEINPDLVEEWVREAEE